MKKKTMPKPLTIMNIGKEVILPVKMARSISIKNNALKSHWKISRNFMTFISYDMLSIKCQKDNLEICLYEVITFKRISCKVCHKTFSPNRRLNIHIERNHKSNWIISNFCFLIWISIFSNQIFEDKRGQCQKMMKKRKGSNNVGIFRIFKWHKGFSREIVNRELENGFYPENDLEHF